MEGVEFHGHRRVAALVHGEVKAGFGYVDRIGRAPQGGLPLGLHPLGQVLDPGGRIHGRHLPAQPHDRFQAGDHRARRRRRREDVAVHVLQLRIAVDQIVGRLVEGFPFEGHACEHIGFGLAGLNRARSVRIDAKIEIIDMVRSERQFKDGSLDSVLLGVMKEGTHRVRVGLVRY